MKLSKQVTSRGISQRLQELGVKQESCFDWVITNHYGQNEPDLDLWESKAYSQSPNRSWISAFTVAELGEICRKNKKFDEPFPHLGADGWYYYTGASVNKAKTEADARGKMLVYLIENKLI